ncbi:MAG TPA: 3',5'-cyclic-nucleotide phosphodiesterase [Blastocatellia bacterium]|nr:3',5'-cyclic-nucleotide phosphodiesterase [Blastocatellia bacterium]
MRVKLLASIAGSDSQHQALTTFLVNDRVAVDAGSLGFALAPEEMAGIRDVIITHTHADHTASLPIFVAEAFVSLTSPITIHGTTEVVAALRQFIFNDQMWPDFELIPLGDGSGPSLRFREIKPGVTSEIGGLQITPVQVNHVVPTVGLLMGDGRASVGFTSDTYVTDEFWRAAEARDDLRAVYVDVSYPSEMRELAAASKHLTPELLAGELQKLNRRDVDVLAVHIKPTNRGKVIAQLANLDPPVAAAEIGRTYEW